MKEYGNSGYSTRKQYLSSLVDMYGIDKDTVFYLAEILGESEDFDGLVAQLDDMQQGY